MNRVLMVFIDGVGIGENDKEKNPFFKYGFKLFDEIFEDKPHLENQIIKKNKYFLFPVDANLGVEGLPQSGTGQVAIFTGVNAPKIAGKHFGPFPYSTTIPYIEEQNIFKDLKALGKHVEFVNAYPKQYFDYIRSGRRRLNVTSLCALNSGMQLHNASDLHKGKALSAEITNYRWVERLKYKVPVISPLLAANRLKRIAMRNSFTLYEYFLTDHLGHGRIKDQFEKIYYILDEFLMHLFSNIPDDLTIILCSDHGNFEDISVKSHTRNPALGISAGKNAEYLYRNISKLTDIKSAILNICE